MSKMTPTQAIQELEMIQTTMSPFLSSAADDLIDACITALRAQIKLGWIKVDQPPKVYQHGDGEPMEFIVTIKDATVPTVLSYTGSEWYEMSWITEDGYGGQGYDVTHWMPLPEPPKSEA